MVNKSIEDLILQLKQLLIKHTQQPENFRILNSIANIYLKQHKYNKAIKYYKASIAINPSDHIVYFNRSLAYFQQEKYQQALIDLNSAIGIKNDYTKAYLYRGIIYNNQGKFTDAIGDFSQAIDILPENYIAYINRGLSYDKTKQYLLASFDYQKAVSLKPTSIYALNNFGNSLIQIGKFYEAYNVFSQALNITNIEPIIFYNRAKVNFLIQNYSNALIDLAKAKELNSENLAEINLLQGRCYYKLENKTNAIKCFEQCIDNYENKQSSNKSQFEKAITQINKSILVNKTLHNSYNYLGKCLLELGNLVKAEHYFTMALNLGENSAETHNNIGLLQLKLKNYRLAEKHFKLAIKYQKEFDDSHANLAKTLAKMKDYPNSIDNHNKSIYNNPIKLSHYLERSKTVAKHKNISLKASIIDDTETAKTNFIKNISKQEPLICYENLTDENVSQLKTIISLIQPNIKYIKLVNKKDKYKLNTKFIYLFALNLTQEKTEQLNLFFNKISGNIVIKINQTKLESFTIQNSKIDLFIQSCIANNLDVKVNYVNLSNSICHNLILNQITNFNINKSIINFKLSNSSKKINRKNILLKIKSSCLLEQNFNELINNSKVTINHYDSLILNNNLILDSIKLDNYIIKTCFVNNNKINQNLEFNKTKINKLLISNNQFKQSLIINKSITNELLINESKLSSLNINHVKLITTHLKKSNFNDIFIQNSNTKLFYLDNITINNLPNWATFNYQEDLFINTNFAKHFSQNQLKKQNKLTLSNINKTIKLSKNQVSKTDYIEAKKLVLIEEQIKAQQINKSKGNLFAVIMSSLHKAVSDYSTNSLKAIAWYLLCLFSGSTLVDLAYKSPTFINFSLFFIFLISSILLVNLKSIMLFILLSLSILINTVYSINGEHITYFLYPLINKDLSNLTNNIITLIYLFRIFILIIFFQLYKSLTRKI